MRGFFQKSHRRKSAWFWLKTLKHLLDYSGVGGRAVRPHPAERGTGDSTLSLGDRVDLIYGLGNASTDLVLDASPLAALALPPGISEQALLSATTERIGTRYSVTGPVTLTPGAAFVFDFAATTAPGGIAPLAVEMALTKKTAGKFVSRSEFRVVKTAPLPGSEPFFGDGSDLDLVITSDAALEPLRNYANVRIATGVRVTVPSGSASRLPIGPEHNGQRPVPL